VAVLVAVQPDFVAIIVQNRPQKSYALQNIFIYWDKNWLISQNQVKPRWLFWWLLVSDFCAFFCKILQQMYPLQDHEQ